MGEHRQNPLTPGEYEHTKACSSLKARDDCAGSDGSCIQSPFGEPYWKDEDDYGITLFYEYGDIEWQVDFNEKKYLYWFLITTPTLFEDEKNRQAYKLMKPWLPLLPFLRLSFCAPPLLPSGDYLIKHSSVKIFNEITLRTLGSKLEQHFQS